MLIACKISRIDYILDGCPSSEPLSGIGKSLVLTNRQVVSSSLRKLEISFCDDISTEALKCIGYFRELEEISLWFMKAVTDDVVYSITSNCKNVKSVVISGEFSRQRIISKDELDSF